MPAMPCKFFIGNLGDDYTPFNTTLTIPKGSNSATYDVMIKNDDLVENQEQFEVNFELISGSTIAITPGGGTVNIIVDDDGDGNYNIKLF